MGTEPDQWEYWVEVNLPFTDPGHGVEDRLNERGAEGWELVAIPSPTCAYFKRRVPKTE